MSINGPGHGFSNPAGRYNAASSAGVFKKDTTDTKKAGGAGAAAPSAPAKGSDGISISNLLGTVDVAPPPTFNEITRNVVSDISRKDPQEALDEGIQNPDLKQWLQLGYVPVV
ncbi:MAG TPA: hypothetical protein V6C52_01710 [Coleofasciculaceae cyanobacterium]|jgi:hypothetical protein